MECFLKSAFYRGGSPTLKCLSCGHSPAVVSHGLYGTYVHCFSSAKCSRFSLADLSANGYTPSEYVLVTQPPALRPNLVTTPNTKPQRSCQCGMWATGHEGARKGMHHMTYCPDYDTTIKERPETHEELVARVKAAKKGFGVKANWNNTP